MVNLPNENGTISITSDVFMNIAGDAATNCFGVKGMASISKENGLVQLLRRESMSKGVFISFNEDASISIALHIVVDYGVNLTALANSIMNEVSYKVSSVTGVSVRSVDVYFDSMLLN